MKKIITTYDCGKCFFFVGWVNLVFVFFSAAAVYYKITRNCMEISNKHEFQGRLPNETKALLKN
jgi:hypothetical protein